MRSPLQFTRLGILALALLATIANLAPAQGPVPPRGEGKTSGMTWLLQTADERGGNVHDLFSAKVRARDFSLTLDGAGKEVGRYARTGRDQYSLEFTDGRLKGVRAVVQAAKGESKYQGPFTDSSGKKGLLIVTIVAP